MTKMGTWSPRACAVLLGILACAVARAGQLTDASDVVVEADVTAVMQRFHEAIPTFPVQVYTLSVCSVLKGSAPQQVTLVVPGGRLDDDSTVTIVDAPSLNVGEHVLVFGRVRDLADSGKVAEADGLRLTAFTGIYRRLDGAPALAYDAKGRPLALETVDGATFVGPPLPPEADDQVVKAVELPAADWDAVVGAIATEVSLPGKNARPALTLGGVAP